MAGRKHFDKIAWTVTALMLVVTVLFMNGEALGIEAAAQTMGYENRLFDNTKVHTIEIVMDDWDSFLGTAESETYSAASVIIDGEAYSNVGIRGKGNTSLSSVASMDSQRYSFKLEFDHYDNAKSYYGLDKLSPNNLIQDNTMMKDYLTYTMMKEMGVAAPLCSFVYITVNGEDWGLYLAVEGVEEAFLARNYGSDYGALYKPDSTSFGGGRGNGRDFDFSKMDGGNGGLDMGASDVKLQYIDDQPSSYSNIFENAKTEITDADQARLIQSLKTLSEGGDVSSVVDVDAVLRYFVVHNYVCNGDSYTGTMIHNYYLYEKDGVLSMIPWDYNLAYGTFMGGDASSQVNAPIDTPASSDGLPMLDWIFESEAYTERYHQLFAEFLNTVDIMGILDRAAELIAPYVEKDPTKFCTAAEFETGVTALRQFCTLRTESVLGQLAGVIPATTAGQSADSTALIDTGELKLSDMGTMSGGQGPDGGGFAPTAAMAPDGGFEAAEGTPPDGGTLPEDGLPQEPGAPGEDAGGAFGEHGAAMGVDGNAAGPEPEGGPAMEDPGDSDRGAPGSFEEAPASGDAAAWIWLGMSAVILAVGLVVAKKYRA